MELQKLLVISLQKDFYKLLCVFVMFGVVCGNHLHGQGGGFIEQSLSFDPFLLPQPQASSSASSSATATAGGASSMASSSAGASSSSSRSSAGRQRNSLRRGGFDTRLQDQLARRNRLLSSTRRRPVRLVVLRPDRRTGQTSTRVHDLLLRQRQRQRQQQQQRGTSLPVQLPFGGLTRQVQLPIPRRLQLQQLQQQQQRQQTTQQQVVPLDEVLGVLSLLLGDMGPQSATQPPVLTPRFGDLFNGQQPATVMPPGLTFLGGPAQLPQLPIVEQVPARTFINRLSLPRINSFPSASSSASSSAGVGGASSSASSSAGFVNAGAAASPANKSFLDANSLTIEGQTPSGDLIIGGPGGTITIGAEVLNAISRTGNASLIHTEFEEMEAEEGLMGRKTNPKKGLRVASQGGRRPLVLSGKRSVVPKRRPASSIRIVGQNNMPLVGQSNFPLLVKGHPPLSSQSNQPLLVDNASIMTLNSTGSGLKTVASGSSISGEVSVAASSSSGSSGLRTNGQNGISVTSGAQGSVIHLKGKDTIVVGGGSGGRIDVGNTVSGVKAPGNATFIVGG